MKPNLPDDLRQPDSNVTAVNQQSEIEEIDPLYFEFEDEDFDSSAVNRS